MRSIKIMIFGLLAVFCAASVPVFCQMAIANVKTVEEHWPNGQLRLRKQVLQREDGTLVDHGTFERWHDNGKKEYEALFVQGKKEGMTIRYHKNGRKATEQEYKNGRRHGRALSWNDTGALVKEENWFEGKPHGTWIIWQDGKAKWSHTYDHGKP